MLHHTSFLWDYDDAMMKALKVGGGRPGHM